MIKIVTDSGSDITQEKAKKLDVTVLPLKITFGEEDYYDGITINHTKFYDMLVQSKDLPKTSLVPPSAFESAFNNEDQIICITVASALSGCYQSAKIAQDDRENIIVIDSKSATIGQAMLVEYAVNLRNEGKDFQTIVEEIKKATDELYLIAMVDTLEYLRKGGRISTATAAIGSVLSIKPVITLKDGVIEVLGKARGVKNAISMIKDLTSKAGEFDFNKPYLLAHSGNERSSLDKYLEETGDFWCNKDTENHVITIGAAIGTHVGPGAFGAALFLKK